MRNTNTNPTLINGQALAWLDAQPEDVRPRSHERQYVELRVYTPTGAGFFFVRSMAANRWYYKEAFDSDHFCRPDQSDLDAAIAAGGRVQLCGSRGQSFGVWENWPAFSAATGA